MTAAAVELVPFRGGAIEALLHNGRPWCAVRSICTGLGLDVKSQHAKLKTKPWAVMVFITTTAADGKNYQTLCIDLDSLPMWLATIEPSRVKPEARDALVAYQREAAQVLRDHFLGRGGSTVHRGQSDAEPRDDRAPQERWVLVETLLRDPRWAPLSDRSIAHASCCRPDLVGKVRRFLEEQGELPPHPVRLGRDQWTMDTAQIGGRSRLDEILAGLQEIFLEVQSLRQDMDELRPLRFVGSAEMAETLGISLSRFQALYQSQAELRSLALEVGTRGEGTELRWDPREVAALLRVRRPAVRGRC